jgi:hypothetical protein
MCRRSLRRNRASIRSAIVGSAVEHGLPVYTVKPLALSVMPFDEGWLSIKITP